MTKPGRKGSSDVNTGEIVLSAIKKLTKNTGWTVRTIVKFIKLEYKIGDPALSKKVSRALKRGVKLGLIQSLRGRYRLSDMSASKPDVSTTRDEPRVRQKKPAERVLRISSRPQSPKNQGGIFEPRN